MKGWCGWAEDSRPGRVPFCGLVKSDSLACSIGPTYEFLLPMDESYNIQTKKNISAGTTAFWGGFFLRFGGNYCRHIFLGRILFEIRRELPPHNFGAHHAQQQNSARCRIKFRPSFPQKPKKTHRRHHGQLGISLTFPPHFFSYSPTGSTWLRHGVQFCQHQAYVLRLETYYGLRRR